MPLLVLLFFGVPSLFIIRRIRFFHAVGQRRYVHRMYMIAALGISLLVPLCMGVQIFLLAKMGMATLQTVLPLHLCSFVGVLTPFMLLTRSQGLFEFSLYLGLPGALAALVFPAVLKSPWPFLMEGAFFSLHALLVIAPLLRMADGAKPRRFAMGRVFLSGNILLLAVYGVNALLGTNYFFLRIAPQGTPLQAMQLLGQAAYVAALEAVALVLLKLESFFYKRFSQA